MYGEAGCECRCKLIKVEFKHKQKQTMFRTLINKCRKCIVRAYANTTANMKKER